MIGALAVGKDIKEARKKSDGGGESGTSKERLSNHP